MKHPRYDFGESPQNGCCASRSASCDTPFWGPGRDIRTIDSSRRSAASGAPKGPRRHGENYHGENYHGENYRGCRPT